MFDRQERFLGLNSDDKMKKGESCVPQLKFRKTNE